MKQRDWETHLQESLPPVIFRFPVSPWTRQMNRSQAVHVALHHQRACSSSLRLRWPEEIGYEEAGNGPRESSSRRSTRDVTSSLSLLLSHVPAAERPKRCQQRHPGTRGVPRRGSAWCQSTPHRPQLDPQLATKLTLLFLPTIESTNPPLFQEHSPPTFSHSTQWRRRQRSSPRAARTTRPRRSRLRRALPRPSR